MGWKDIYEDNKKATSNSAGSGGSWKDIYNQNRKSDYETIYSSTGSLGNRIYSSLNSRNYADFATIEQLRGNINEYKSNVNSLKEAGYDVGKAISGFADIDNAFSQYENYWKQFGSAEQYYNALDKYNAYQDKYGKYTSYDDYADISKQRPNEKIDITDFDKYEARKANNYTYNIDGTVTDIFGDVVDETYNERIQQPLVKDRLGAWLNSSDADKNRYLASDSVSDSYGWNDYSQTMRRGTEGYWDEIKPEEIDLYYYLYNTQGADKAYQYLDDMFTEFEARQAQKEAEAVNNAGIGTQILLNVASVPLNVIGGVPSYLSDLGKIITNQDIDYNDTAHYMSRMASNIRGKTATDIEKATNNLALPFIDFTFGDAYQSLMSGADSALGATMFGKGYTVMMGMSAASSEAKRLFDKGASRGQILAGSVLSGAAEIVFESVSLDHFLKTKDTKTLKQLAIQILEQAGVEGSEEVATDIANLINNLAVMGKDADIINEINGYMAEGDSKASASAKALLSFAEDLGSSFLGGALSGGAMGGIGSTANLINYNSYTKSAGESVNLQGNVSDVATNAKAIAEQNKDKKTIKRAEQILDKVNKGNISKSDYKNIGQLYDYAVNDKNGKITDVVKEEAKKILDEKSISNAEKISAAVADVYEGTASEAQKDLVNKNGGEKLVKDAVKAARENAKTSERLAELYVAESKAFTPSSNKTVFESLNEAKHNVLDDTIDEENADNIASIKEAKNGNVIVTLEDGTEKNLNDVTFANADTALVYESVKAIGYDTETANSIVNAYKSTKGTIAENFILGMKQGYQYGLTNNTKAFSDAKGYFADLSEANRNLAYRLGQEASQRKFAPLNIENKNGNKPKGRVVIASELRANITERQAASLAAIGNITSRVTGNNVVIYASTEENNKRVLPYDIGGRKKGDLAPNGFYDPKTGTIYLDLYAGNNGEGTMLWTYSHELTHFVRQWSPDKFKSLADFLVDEYGKSGKNLDELIASQMAKAKRNGRSLDYYPAYEEVVADFMQTMFTDTNLTEKLAQIKAKDETLFQKIKSFFVNLLKKIKEAYAGLEPSSEEAKFVKNMGDSVQKVVDLFAEGIVEAGQNFNIGSINLSDYSAAITENGEQLFQYRAMEADEARYRAMLEKTNVIDKTQIDDLLDTINEALTTIKGNLEALDYAWEADIDGRSFAPAKPNSDSLYQVSIDFSTLCRKRLLQQGVQNILQAALGREITKEEGIVIRDALKQVKEEGREIEVACALCYVESARMKSNEQIQKFLDSRESLIKEFFAGTDKGETKKAIAVAEKSKRVEIANRYNNNAIIKMSLKEIKSEYGKPVADEIREAKRAVKRAYEPTSEQISLINKAETMTVSDFTTPEGLTNLAKNYPQLFDAYTSFVRNATKSKGVESDVWWRAGDSKSIGDALIEKMNLENGLRSQSWSDFQVIHLMDYIAAIIELSTRNAKMQAYTKVPDYVRLMGLTNQMINLSLIPAAKFNGSLEYDSVEGIDYQTAIDLRDKYPDTAGTICIGINTEQIKMLLADDTIDYVIPYHQSGMSKKVRGLMHIPTWESYEKFQNEAKFASRAEAEENAKKMGVAIDEEKYGKKPNFSDWFNYNRAKAIAEASKSESNPLYGGYMAMRDAAENYKKVCASRGLKPRFESLANEANYWKLLIDRKMVNQKTGAVIEQKTVKPIFDRSEVLGILNREIERYPSVKMDQDYATRTVLNKFASGEFDKKLSALTLKSLKNNLDKLSQYNIIKSEENTQQMNSDRDSEDNKLTEEQREFFKGSKVRDEDGNLLVVYHGTDSEFTVFDMSKGRANMDIQGSFFSPWEIDAGGYGRNVKAYYLNITNPAPEGVAYKALNLFKGQNEAGIKARNYLEKLGYDGVNNGNEEYIAFHPNQIKLVDNLNPTENDDIRYSDRDSEGFTIDLSNETELSNLIGNRRGSEKYKIIQRYIFEKVGDEVVFSDGLKAKVDKSDALHIANKSASKKTAEISAIDRLTKSAVLFAEDSNATHNKFKSFVYYEAFAKYEGNVYPIYFNVGLTKNNDGYHLYDITHRIKDTAHRINGVGRLQEFRPASNVFYRNNTTLSEKSQEEKLSDRDYSANIDSVIAREYGTKTNEEFKALVEKAKSEMVKDTESNDNFANVESSIDKVIDWLSERYDSKAQRTDDAKNLLKEIRSTRVYLNEQQKQEVKNRYGSYGKYVQSMFGRMGIADNARVAIDTYYNELADKHPELFDKNANPNEIPLLMSEAIDKLQNTFEARDTDVNMQRDSMFNDIFRMLEENIEQERILATDPRTLLSRALMSVAQNDSEKMTLAHYKNAIKELNDNQKLLADANKRIAELSRSTDEEDMITLESLKDAAKQLTAEINKGDKKLLNLETTKPLKELLARETKKASDQARELGTKALNDYRTKVEDKLNTIKDMVKRDKVNGYYVPRIEKAHAELTDLIAHPTAKKHIPMAFNSAVANFLKMFDFSDFTKTGAIKNTNANFSRLNARVALQALAQQFDENTKDDAYNNVEIAPEMREWLKALTDNIETFFSREYIESRDRINVSENGTIFVNQLSEDSLKNLYRLVRGLKTTLNRAGRYYDNNARDVSTDAESTMHFTEPLAKKNPSSLLYKVSKTFMWDYAQPITAFMRFGEGGMARYRELIKAQSKMAYHQQKLNEFIDSAYSESEAQEWQKTFVTIKLDGKDYQASVEQLMSLHCLLKQEDSRRHMLEGGGIRLSDNVVDGKIVRYEDSFVSVEEATEIEKMLKRDFPRAVEVADKMQEYMDTVGTDWGNEISMARFGFKQFGVTNYFPIRTIKAGSELEAQQRRANIYALLNKSFTKERNIKANNTIVVSGIFNVFSNHMAEMALYNAWALPVLDLLKWYNYKEGMDIDNKLNERSVVRSLELAYGNYADEYIRRLLESINSQQSGGLSESIAFTNLRMFNRVAVAGNIRVAVQQPFSITRAMDVIAPKYIRLLSTKDRKAAYNEMVANSGIAVWKSLGYYDVDIALPFEKSVRKGETFADKFTEKSMALAEAGDNYTWATLWNACKTEQKAKNPNISNEELLAKTTDRFNDVILQTQVVDTVLQKSQWMRSTSFWHRMTSSFMSEPMTSYNMLLRKFDAYSRDLAVMDKKSAFNKNFKPIAKSMLVFAITELVNALVTAPIDAARDDDDYKTYWQKLLENFKDNAIQNLIPLNMMPYLADIVEYIVYGKTDRPDMQILTKIVDLANSVKNVISNYDYIKLHKTIKSVLDMASSLSGLPMGNMTRDVISLWNTVVGDVNYGQLKFQTSKDSSAVGYDNMYEAIQKGNTERAAYLYAQLLSNSVDPSSIYSGLVSRMKDDYIDKEITEDEAQKYLREISDYTGKGLTDNDIYWWFDEYRHKREGSADKYTKYAEFFTAIDSGENLESIVKKYTDNEVSTSTLASRITSNYKATYINASESERKILKEKLLKAYEALGYDREKKSKDIDKWLK